VSLSLPALVARLLDMDQGRARPRITLLQAFASLASEVKKRVRSGAPGFRSQLDHRGRIMTYVLIVVSWLGGAVNGAAVSTQEFANVERCEAARLALVADAKARALEDQLRPICLQK
jgi:hypothetical protein